MSLPFELKKSAGKFESDFVRAQYGIEVSHELPHEEHPHSKLQHYVEEARHLSHHSHHVIHHSHGLHSNKPLEKTVVPISSASKTMNDNDEQDESDVEPAGKRKEKIDWEEGNESFGKLRGPLSVRFSNRNQVGLEGAKAPLETFKMLHGDTFTDVWDSTGDYLGRFRKMGNFSPGTVTTAKGEKIRTSTGKLAVNAKYQKVISSPRGTVKSRVLHMGIGAGGVVTYQALKDRDKGEPTNG